MTTATAVRQAFRVTHPALLALALVGLASDDLTFLVMVSRDGMGAEVNPIVISLAEPLGPAGVVVLRTVFIVGFVLTTGFMGGRYSKVCAGAYILLAAIGFFGAFTNVLTIAAGT